MHEKKLVIWICGLYSRVYEMKNESLQNLDPALRQVIPRFIYLPPEKPSPLPAEGYFRKSKSHQVKNRKPVAKENK